MVQMLSVSSQKIRIEAGLDQEAGIKTAHWISQLNPDQWAENKETGRPEKIDLPPTGSLSKCLEQSGES